MAIHEVKVSGNIRDKRETLVLSFTNREAAWQTYIDLSRDDKLEVELAPNGIKQYEKSEPAVANARSFFK